MRRFLGKTNGPAVWAERVIDVTPIGDIVTSDGARYTYTGEWRRQWNPQAGNFLVLHDSGAAQMVAARDFATNYAEAADMPPGANPPPTGAAAREAARDKVAKESKGAVTPEQKAINEQREKEQSMERSERAASTIQAQQERENEDTERVNREREERERKEREDAQHDGEAEKDDGGGGAQQAVRKEGGHPAERGQGLQPSRHPSQQDKPHHERT